MEDLHFPDGLPDGVRIVGGMHALDVSDMQHDGSRKSYNMYGAPQGVGSKCQSNADLWPPIAFLPNWKHPNTDAGRARSRALLRECLDICFECYDGSTYIHWRTKDGEDCAGLLALASLVVDGGDYPWLVNNRGANGLFGCGRCRIPTSLIGSNVTELWRWKSLRRTYADEVSNLQAARAIQNKASRNHFLAVSGLNDAIDNPMYEYFGSLKERGWVAARRLAFERLHSIEAGVAMHILQLMIQMPQLLHEADGIAPCADSPAAQFADLVSRQSAKALQVLVAAVPSARRHCTWPVQTSARLITRDRGKQKPKLKLIDFRYCNGWHYRDLGRVMAVWVLQPEFLGATLSGPDPNPCCEVVDFFGEYRAKRGSQPAVYVRHSHLVGLAELSYLFAEVWCLLVAWYDLYLCIPKSDRHLQDLRVLDDEFHEAAKAILNYKATWKKHQMEEAGESIRDLGVQVGGNLTEAAHKVPKLLFRLASNRSLTDFSSQVMVARNRLVGAQMARRQYERALKPSASHATTQTTDEPALPSTPQPKSSLTRLERKWTLRMEVDHRYRVVSLSSSCGVAQQCQHWLLETMGYRHLYWCIINFLSELNGELEQDGRDWPLTTLQLHPSIAVGQSGCPKAAAAPRISMNPFSRVSTRPFARVDADGDDWFGQPLLGVTITTLDGTQYEGIYFKWLDHALTGPERLKLPLPTAFPLHQWAKTYMGLPPLGGHMHPASESFGLIDVSKVLNWEPIVSIGCRTWCPTSAYLEAGSSVTSQKRKHRASKVKGVRINTKQKGQAPALPAGVGEMLFANNVHVWSFGGSS